jgi:uncharacterized small protein (DUF1192 family)
MPAPRDDDEPPIRRPPEPRDLSRLSVEELEARIRELEAEIARTREALRQKRSVRDAAEAAFRRP